MIAVDDLAPASNSPHFIKKFKTILFRLLDVRLYGKLSIFIGWNLFYHLNIIKLDQQGYIKEIFEQSGMLYANPTGTPLPKNADLSSANEVDHVLSKKDHPTYRSIIGRFLYLATYTRPDLSFCFSVLALHLYQPIIRHFILLRNLH